MELDSARGQHFGCTGQSGAEIGVFGMMSSVLLGRLKSIFFYLTVAVPEIRDILEIQKMKIWSEVPNFMGKMNFRSKCA